MTDGDDLPRETLLDGSGAAVAAEARPGARHRRRDTRRCDSREWFAAAGLTDVRVAPVPRADRTTVTGRPGERTVEVD